MYRLTDLFSKKKYSGTEEKALKKAKPPFWPASPFEKKWTGLFATRCVRCTPRLISCASGCEERRTVVLTVGVAIMVPIMVPIIALNLIMALIMVKRKVLRIV